MVEGVDMAPPLSLNGLRKVLIVDDLVANRIILEKQLRQLRLEVTSCTNGPEALERLTDGFDLVITDHNMPEMDGPELAQAIRASGLDVPMILLSSNPGFARNDPARDLFRMILQKPQPRNDLFAALGHVQPDQENLTEPPPEPAEESRKLRILAADDNRTNRLVLEKMLKPLEIDLHFAEDGEQAISLYQKLSPDLIFMDISMPKIDGREATRRIREIETGCEKHTHIIALTAHALKGDEDEVRQAGLDAYLTKPLRKKAIFGAIEEFSGYLPLKEEPLQAASG